MPDILVGCSLSHMTHLLIIEVEPTYLQLIVHEHGLLIWDLCEHDLLSVQLLIDLIVGVDHVDCFGGDDEVVLDCDELLVCDSDPCELEFVGTVILLQHCYSLFACHHQSSSLIDAHHLLYDRIEFLLLFETYHYFSLNHSHLVLVDASVQDCK